MEDTEKYNLSRPMWLLPTPKRNDEMSDEGLRGLLLNLMQGKNLSRREAAYLLN